MQLSFWSGRSPVKTMIVSALLTSVAINLGICIVFFTLYSVLKKHPGRYDVYIPHLLAYGKSRQNGEFNLQMLLPTSGWVRRAWQLSEEDLLSTCGLDAVVFMRIIIIFRCFYALSFAKTHLTKFVWMEECFIRTVPCGPLICSLIKSPCSRSSNDEIELPSLPYHQNIPRLLFFGLLGFRCFFLAPLILPFILVYFCLVYLIYRNQLELCSIEKFVDHYTTNQSVEESIDDNEGERFINVYGCKYETAGKFWPIVHNSIIFSVILMNIIAAGIFAVKKLPMASTLIIPLPIFTILFNAYRRRFLPMFVAYSTETLLKKDREDPAEA